MKKISKDDSIDIYEKSLRTRGKSDNTIKNYKCAVVRFFDINDIKNIEDISLIDIIRFKDEINNNETGGRSMNVYLTGIRSYLKMMYEHGFIDKDLSVLDDCKGYTDDVIRKMRGRRQEEDPDDLPGNCINNRERKLLIRAALKNNRRLNNQLSTIGERNAIMIKLCLIIGTRISDLVKLKFSDFYKERVGKDENIIEEWKLKYIAKKTGRKVSIFVGNDEIMDEILDYIRKNNIGKNEYLFKTGNGSKMEADSFCSAFKKIATDAGIKYLSSHDMRRTMATRLYESGISLKVISERLGHADTTMTEKYLRLSEGVEDVYDIKKALAVMI